MVENQDNTITNKTYKEIEIVYGSDIKSSSIEFRYSEPKKLQEIEKFFIEFYISVRNNSDVYYNMNHELTYFDYSIIYTINEILVAHKNMINHPNIVEFIISKINTRLYENYMKMKLNGANKISIVDKQRDREVDLKAKGDKDSNRGLANMSFLYISKDTILNEMFKDHDNELNNYHEVDGGFYKKEEDGWAVRDIEVEDKITSKKNVAAIDLNNTITLSNNGMNTHRKVNDCSMNLSNRYSVIKPESEHSDSYYFRKDGNILDVMDNSSIKEQPRKDVKKMKTTVQLKMHDIDYNKSAFKRMSIQAERVIIKSKTAFNYSYDDNLMGSVGSDESYPNKYKDRLPVVSSGISNPEYESDL
jgi:hypothetical protein